MYCNCYQCQEHNEELSRLREVERLAKELLKYLKNSDFDRVYIQNELDDFNDLIARAEKVLGEK